jgi:hypothetical protein
MRFSLLLALALLMQCAPPDSGSRLSFTISFTRELSDQAQDGRLLLLLANNDKTEPRFQIGDGYPKRIFNKETGDIDSEVAAYWREHYDLRYILERDWKTLGPKLQGKIHIYCGDMDNYYLNNAVYLMEDFLKKTNNPFYAGEVDYGDRAEHCWNGDHENPNYISRLRYNTMYLPRILKRIEQSAPKGADLKSWRY